MLLARRIGPSRYPQAGGYDSRARPRVIYHAPSGLAPTYFLSTPPLVSFSRLASEIFLIGLAGRDF